MKKQTFFIIFKGLSLKQIKRNFFGRWESEFNGVEFKFKCFPGASSNDFIPHINPTLQNPENLFETSILLMGVNDFLKRDSNIDAATNNIMSIGNEF